MSLESRKTWVLGGGKISRVGGGDILGHLPPEGKLSRGDILLHRNYCKYSVHSTIKRVNGN